MTIRSWPLEGLARRPSFASHCAWLATSFDVDAICIRDLGMLTAEDEDVFRAARAAGAVLMTKDRDFAELVTRLGAPPFVIWVTCGNTSNDRMREILATTWDHVERLVESGEPLVEIADVLSERG